ncbi:MAG: aminoacyl-tRNA hydrolase [Ruminococcaceae bacterium]|nr:aminoacyl-tRNA hydrolase [Oscillospiraceae bacterium]
MSNIFDLFRKIEKKESAQKEPISFLIVGLGNTGKQYAGTRHNTGFLALDFIAASAGTTVDHAKFHSLVGEAVIEGVRVLLMKPQTLMNLSGLAVGEAADFYKIPASNVIVISDDISLPVAHLRVRRKGSAGGHNGLKDIISCLGTEDFPRIRIGIGEKPHPDYDLADWVLSSFSETDRKLLQKAFPIVESGLKKLLLKDFDGAMQLCNGFLPEGENA